MELNYPNWKYGQQLDLDLNVNVCPSSEYEGLGPLHLQDQQVHGADVQGQQQTLHTVSSAAIYKR